MKRSSSLSLLSLVMIGLAASVAGCGQRAAQQARASVRPTEALARGPAVLPPHATFTDYPVAPNPADNAQLAARGKVIYDRNCAACHGVNGDGKGDAAPFLLPRPRNFRKAKYRLRSTPTGSLPTDVDLFRAVSLGVPGTPMPPWRFNLGDEERWAVVEYLKTFSPRFGETNAEHLATVDLGTPPPRNEEAIAEGKALFTKLNCYTCHGEGGHGDGTSAAGLVDDSGSRIKPRDFSKPGQFKSGYATKEIVRTVLTGFDGTPMVGFNGIVSGTDAWKLAYYVETFARPAPPPAYARASQNFLVREELGAPDVRIKLTERAWHYDPAVIRVQKGQIVEITFEPTDNGLGVGHGFGISSYDEVAFINGAMVGAPKVVKFRADRAGKFTYYCATQCSTDKLHPLMSGTLFVEDAQQVAAAR